MQDIKQSVFPNDVLANFFYFASQPNKIHQLLKFTKLPQSNVPKQYSVNETGTFHSHLVRLLAKPTWMTSNIISRLMFFFIITACIICSRCGVFCEGKWEVEEMQDTKLPGDKGLVLKSRAKHHAISGLLLRPFIFETKSLIVQ